MNTESRHGTTHSNGDRLEMRKLWTLFVAMLGVVSLYLVVVIFFLVGIEPYLFGALRVGDSHAFSESLAFIALGYRLVVSVGVHFTLAGIVVTPTLLVLRFGGSGLRWHDAAVVCMMLACVSGIAGLYVHWFAYGIGLLAIILFWAALVVSPAGRTKVQPDSVKVFRSGLFVVFRRLVFSAPLVLIGLATLAIVVRAA